MRIILFVAFAISLTSPSVFAKDSSHSNMDPKKQEMMKKWMEYATPGAQHKIFQTMAGKWKYTSNWWESADGQPMVSKGTSTLKLIMGGRFLENRTKGKAMGMPFEGLGLTGYDNLKKTYDSLWLDSMGTGTMHGTGTFDEETQTLTDTGEFSCPMSSDKKRKFRSEWKIIDKNNMTFSMWAPGPEGGKEFKNMEMIFSRVN